METKTTLDTFNETGAAIAMAIVQAVRSKGIDAKIATTYLDYGQNWKWETVLVGTGSSAYQALSPRQFKSMNDGTFDFSEINDIVKTAESFNFKY